jgi:phosphoribosyl-AMP cyclohydrolase
MDRQHDALGISDLTYDDRGLIPAVVQQYDTLEVLMMAWMDHESLAKTVEDGSTWFYSRSRQAYWKKGQTSGAVQLLREIRYDCDADTLLVLVDQQGSGACHTGARTCFYRTLYSAAAAQPSEGRVRT